MTLVAKPLGPSLGFDTSENLTQAQLAALAGQGFRWACRYVPLAGQSPTAPGVIQAAELAAAAELGLGVMFVQFARTSAWSASTGLADGQAAAAYMLALGVPPEVALFCDLDVTPSADVAIAYVNAWMQGVVHAGVAASAAGVYCEPGVPLTAQQRYASLNVTRYWATAANDPARFPSNRGCQLVQLWASSRGEYSPIPGIEIDADVAELDWFGSAAIAAIGEPT